VEFCQVRLEAHQHGATMYVTGLLADLAASRAEALIAQVPIGTAVIRVDLRGVVLIDPRAFVRVARSLNHWRDLRRGRVTIEFPERSAPRTPVRPRLIAPHTVGASPTIQPTTSIASAMMR
jgi:hypothetical protein